ncbi:GerAB/ArcD/ProY family transporter [Alkalihalobacillus sp. 1P02AB]|uniref:GerAB/ArcD/ProY family transporter n=1 Tax=Alkalihalobacillus sp. 1P02AB TaxID=3132260 RepID=UPI0039A5D4EB
MKNLINYQMSPLELIITMTSFIFGVGILILPRGLAQDVGTTDGWLTILISGVISMIIVYLFVRVQVHFPGQNYFEFINFGKMKKWPSMFLSLLFLLYFFILIPFQVRIFGVAIKMYLLDQTPLEVIIGSMLVVVFYAVSKGVQGIVHINLMYLPIILFVLLLGFVLNVGELNLSTFLPLFSEGIIPVIKGIPVTMYSFIGVFCLLFLMGSLKPLPLRAWQINIGMLIVIVIHLLYFLVSVAIFSLEALKIITFPTIELFKEIEVPGGFFERIESVFITMWVMSIFTTLTLEVIMAQLLIKGVLFKKKKNLWVSGVIAFLIYMMAFIPSSIVELAKMGEWSGYIGSIATGFALLFGFMAVWHKNKKQTNRSSSAGM